MKIPKYASIEAILIAILPLFFTVSIQSQTENRSTATGQYISATRPPVPIAVKNTSPLSINVIGAPSTLIEGKPFPITVRIENLGNEAFDFNRRPVVRLRDSSIPAWKGAPAGSTASATIEMKACPIFTKLAKGESLEFTIDITGLSWSGIEATYVPDQPVFSFIDKGEYYLFIDVWSDELVRSDGEKGRNIRSPEGIKVTYNPDQK